jgi:hypothetical protein
MLISQRLFGNIRNTKNYCNKNIHANKLLVFNDRDADIDL